MKLADIKRLTIGTKLRCTFSRGCGGKCDEERIIVKMQTNAMVLQRPDGKEGWLWFPKAAQIQSTPKGFRALDGIGELLGEYEVLP